MSFHIALITPSRYDEDGYVQQWQRPVMATQAQAVLKGLLIDCEERGLLGPDFPITIEDHYEIFAPVPIQAIVERIKASEVGAVFLTGILSSQFPRALDLARQFRQHDIPVVLGGVHINGVMALFDDMSYGLQDVLDMGASLFVGQAEGQIDEMLLDLRDGAIKPIYNYHNIQVDLRNAPMPSYDVETINRSYSGILPIETSRGCPFKCSFSCIPNTQGTKMQMRDPQVIADYVRDYNQRGVKNFFLSDDNIARNKEWPIVFDKLAEAREKYGLRYQMIIEADTVAYKVPGFVEKAAAAGVTDVFLGLESIDADTLKDAGKKHNRAANNHDMFKAWYEAGYVTLSGFIVGFPNDDIRRVHTNIETLSETFPGEIFTLSILTPLPGSVDHKRLAEKGTRMNEDLNDYDLGHLVFDHEHFTSFELEAAKPDFLGKLYSFRRIWNIMLQGLTNPAKPVTNFSWSVMLMLGYRVTGGGVYELGSGRFRNRLLRRPGLPIESPLVYYPKYGLKTAIFGVKAGVVVGILKVMLLVAKRRAKAFRAAGLDEATATMAAPAE